MFIFRIKCIIITRWLLLQSFTPTYDKVLFRELGMIDNSRKSTLVNMMDVRID